MWGAMPMTEKEIYRGGRPVDKSSHLLILHTSISFADTSNSQHVMSECRHPKNIRGCRRRDHYTLNSFIHLRKEGLLISGRAR
jgi:hypothetical protein